MKLNIIDNLFYKTEIPRSMEYFIYQTIINSLKESNTNGEYAKEIIDMMIENSSPKIMLDKLKESYFVYLTNEEDDIVAFGSIYESKNIYYFSWLQVIPKYQGKGYAQILSNHRENVLKEKNIDRVYIESLTFKKTIDYHLKRNFKIDGNQQGLIVSIRMFKDL